MKAKVYLETSFVSYLTGRLNQNLAVLQRQLSSQRWWETQRGNFDVFVSQIVLDEIRLGDSGAARQRSDLLESVALLFVNERTIELANRLIYPGPFPKKAGTDAVHVAIATVYGCDYLLTWNFKHINNAQIKRRATRIIQSYGYQPTTICTPDELLGSDGT